MSLNTKETWKNINDMMNRGKRDDLIKVNDGNGCEIQSKNLANYFNDFFINVPSKLTESLPRAINYDYFRNITPVVDSCVLLPTNIHEVFNILKSFNNKVNRLYDIPPSLLLKVKGKIIPIFVHLFNNCLLAGIYPDSLKVARVVPIFKCKRKSTDVNNYRPISNLSIINKLFEKLLQCRINSFL